MMGPKYWKASAQVKPKNEEGLRWTEVRIMCREKTIPLRRLLREPVKVKRLTRSGQSVQITDNGKPLWLIQPAAQEENDEERARAIDKLLDEALRARRSSGSAVALLEQSRR
jgi:hypothetical protein